MVLAVFNSMPRYFFLFTVIIIASLSTRKAFAQTKPPLERIVTISFNQEKTDVVLNKLSKEGKFTFSYSPSIIDAEAVITSTFTNKTVREILTQLFQGKVQFKEKGNYIILTKTTESQKKASTEPLIITGYVVHAETGEKIPEVSIYDKKTFAAAVTNQYGYFKLKIDKPITENLISVNRKSFQDTLLSISPNQSELITIPLKPDVVELIVPDDDEKTDTLKESIVVIVPDVPPESPEPLSESQANIENIRDTLYRDFQVSLVPFVGTNHKLSGNVINDYSFNIFGGYSLGVTKFELGGLFNVDRGDVSKVQVAGIFNAVGGDVSGVQVAGYVNLNRGKFDGVQIGGNVNVNLSEVKGPQFGGLINVNWGESQGAMFAGLGDVQIHNYRGPQFAGLFNVSTHRIDGGQFSGIMNFAGSVHGSQIALLNIADSVRGVPIGLMSLVRTGYHKIELSADEIFYTNLAFRTGVRQFYNILTVGMKPNNFEDVFWTVGYGIGTAPKITKWMSLNFDVTANQVSQGQFTPALNLLSKLYMGLDFQVAKKFSITTGVTLNGYFTETNYSDYPSLFSDYQPNLIYDKDIGVDGHLQMWWGGKFGIRFL
jgi:hypothetical protein